MSLRTRIIPKRAIAPAAPPPVAELAAVPEPVVSYVVVNRLPTQISNVRLRAGIGLKSVYENTSAVQNIQVHYENRNSIRLIAVNPSADKIVLQIAPVYTATPVIEACINNKRVWTDQVPLPWDIKPAAPEQLIPRIIHQTYISRSMPAESYRACQTWWLSNLNYEYRFYDDQLCQHLMETWYAPDSAELQAYNMLYAGAYKSDIFRLALLYREGGVWADVSSVCEKPLDSFLQPEDELVVCVDSPCQKRYANIHQAYIFVVPQHAAIAHILEYTVSTVIHRRFETPGMVFQSIAVTGPTAFAEGLNDYLGRRPLEFFHPDSPIHLFQDDDISENPFRFTPYITEHNIRFLNHAHGKIWIDDSTPVITTKFPKFSQYRQNVHYSILGNMGYIYKQKLQTFDFMHEPLAPVWQIWLQSPYVSRQMAAAMQTWQDQGDYCFVTEAAARVINTLPEVWQAIDTVRPHAYKCDLLRALLLYVFGGLYVDADMVCLQSLRPLMAANTILLLSSGTEQIDNGLMYFKTPGHPLLLHYLNRAVAQIKSRITVTSDLALTGPRLWTACVQEYFNWETIPQRSAWTMQNDRIGLLTHEAITPNYADCAEIQALDLNALQMSAVRTVAPGTTVVTWQNIPYVCTKYPDYNKERLIMGGTNFAAEFQAGSIYA